MPKVTFTFDNGPEPEVTGEVLDILRRHRLHATFFVLGEKLEVPARRALAERAAAEGHWIGNHTYSHSAPLGLRHDGGTAEAEIGRTQRLLGPLAHPNRLFRPIGGGHLDQRLLNPAALDFLIRGRYTCVLWNCAPGDWAEPDRWTERAMAEIRRRPWTLLVLHDLPTGAMNHLEGFIAQLLRENVEIKQDFPPECLPILNGVVTRPLTPYVSGVTQPG